MRRTPVKTPKPPYYSVTTTATLNDAHDPERHVNLAMSLYGKVGKIDGFLGWEVMMEKDFSIAISYWSSLAAIATWRRHEEHRGAKELGKNWFSHCVTRIAMIERDYGFEQFSEQ